MSEILQEIPQPPVTEISLKINYLKFWWGAKSYEAADDMLVRGYGIFSNITTEN